MGAYKGKPRIQFQINSYLRLADLCGADEADLKLQYMSKAEELLGTMDDGSDFNPMAIFPDSVQAFLKDEGVPVNQVTSSVYRKYKEYCIANNFQALSNIEFSRQITKRCGFVTMVKRIRGENVRVFVEAGV